ncbi:hypothetical protein K438DRAFT_252664 [Mycena galopus ATCC 62051]|nr:hypothetical protein K438DRAFT_252664 [Mycena galopus ATCC 62051]
MTHLETILEVPPLPRPPSTFSYTPSDSQRTTTDTSTIWGLGTLSGRALLALGEATVRGINSLVIIRRLATIRRAWSLDKSMCDDLLDFSRPAMYPAWIGKEASRLILTQLCVQSKYAVLAVALCRGEWSTEEARLIILELIRNLSPLWKAPKWQLKGIYSFLAAILQVKERWRDLVVEARKLLRSIFPDQQPFHHPIDMLSTEPPTPQPTPLSRESYSPNLPFAEIQAMYSRDSRQMIWIDLEAAGLPLDSRLREVFRSLAIAEKSTPEYLNARADALIFTSDAFGPELQNAALDLVTSDQCLIDHCVKSRQWDLLYKVGYRSPYDSDVEELIFTATRNQLSRDELYDFVSGYPGHYYYAGVSELFV